MTTDNIMGYVFENWQVVAAVAVGSVLALLLLAALLRAKARPKLSRRVTAAATLLGLGWSAQGMWDTAVNSYHMDEIVAWVLFIVFESMLAARMLRAHQYREDQSRRGKHIASVWVIACIMAVVVALGEGWTQAPARLAIPLLVAYGWYVDLTADDDPAARQRTSLRWTPRRLALWLGVIEAGERDAQQIDRDRLRDRMTRLAFRRHHGSVTLNDLFRRAYRLQRLQTIANDEDIAEVRGRLARSRVDLMTTEPVPLPPAARLEVPVVQRQKLAEPGKMGVHSRAGRTMRGADLRADVVQVMLDSASPDQPLGMPTADLRAVYTPPLGQRTAEDAAAEARKKLREKKINGSAVA